MIISDKLNVRLCRLGISYWDSSTKSKLIAFATRCGLIVVYLSYFLAPAWYFLFEAGTPIEHSKCVPFSLAALLILSWNLTLIFNNEKYTALINEYNSIIEKSE